MLLDPEEVSEDVHPMTAKHKNTHSQRQPFGYHKSKEQKGFSRGAMIIKSPYVYRGSHRERQQAQPSTTSHVLYDSAFENMPSPEYLKSSSDSNDNEYSQSHQLDPNEHYNSYTFLTAPGYRMHK